MQVSALLLCLPPPIFHCLTTGAARDDDDDGGWESSFVPRAEERKTKEDRRGLCAPAAATAPAPPSAGVRGLDFRAAAVAEAEEAAVLLM